MKYTVDENGCWVSKRKNVFKARRAVYEARLGLIFKPLRMTCVNVKCVNSSHNRTTTRARQRTSGHGSERNCPLAVMPALAYVASTVICKSTDLTQKGTNAMNAKTEADHAAQAAARAQADHASAAKQQNAVTEEANRKTSEANARAAQEASQKKEAAERKAEETKHASTAAQSGVVNANANVVQAGIDHSNAVSEANRLAKEESDAKHKEAQRRDTEAGRALSMATQIAVAGPDRTGAVAGAAGYDQPVLDVKPGTDAWHLKFPGEITSGQFNPREESSEQHAEKMGQVNTVAEGHNNTAGA